MPEADPVAAMKLALQELDNLAITYQIVPDGITKAQIILVHAIRANGGWK